MNEDQATLPDKTEAYSPTDVTFTFGDVEELPGLVGLPYDDGLQPGVIEKATRTESVVWVTLQGGNTVQVSGLSAEALIAVGTVVKDEPAPPARPQDFDRYIAVHEAGHVVVADALGFTPQCVKHVEGGLGVGFEAPDKPTPHEFFGMAAIALAGGLAQDRDGSTPDCGCFEDLEFAANHVIDYLARDLPPFHVRVLQRLGRRPYEKWATQEVVDATMQRAASLAQSILSDRWEVVIAVADLIDAHGGELDEQQLAGPLAVFGTGRVQEIRDGAQGPIGVEPGTRVVTRGNATLATLRELGIKEVLFQPEGQAVSGFVTAAADDGHPTTRAPAE